MASAVDYCYFSPVKQVGCRFINELQFVARANVSKSFPPYCGHPLTQANSKHCAWVRFPFSVTRLLSLSLCVCGYEIGTKIYGSVEMSTVDAFQI